MGTHKKEAQRRTRQGDSSAGMSNVKTKGENFYRSAKKVKTLNMYKEGKPERDAAGNITKAASYQSRDVPSARVEPNRRWFNNSRVIGQDSLSAFRTAMSERAKDPYNVLLKTNKLPMSLIRDPAGGKNGVKEHGAKVAVQSAPFAETFGPKAQRKRVKMASGSLEDLAGETERMEERYRERVEEMRVLSGKATEGEGGVGEGGDRAQEEEDGTLTTAREPIFSKGQSKRIWNELYKVVDSSDVILHVLDARDPLGTRCWSVEKYIREEAPHKHLVFLLNKVDLVPTGVAASWVRYLGHYHPTLAFHASLKNSFGKGSLISLLRQYSSLFKNRKQISIGMVGYPNTGKSSIINTLRSKKVCTTAPVPGETKVWQYVTLMKRIFLVDCPGIVPPSAADTEEDILLRGVVRVEAVDNPEQYVPAVLKRVKTTHLERTYDVRGWEKDGEGGGEATARRFLEMLARKSGRLLKGAEPDYDGVARMVINDFLRGRIPWFTPVPKREGEEANEKEQQKDEQKMEVNGEKSKKRKRSDEGEASLVEEGHEEDSAAPAAEQHDEDFGDDTFEGFPSDPQLSVLLDENEASDDSDDDVLGENEEENDDDHIPHHDTEEEHLLEEVTLDSLAYADDDGDEDEDDVDVDDDEEGGVDVSVKGDQ